MRKAILLSTLLLSTLAGKGQTLLSEGFNTSSATTTMPTGWTTSGTGTNVGCNAATWEQVPSAGFACGFSSPSPSPSTYTGTGMAGYNSYDISAGGTSELVSPSLDFSAPGTNKVSFWVFNVVTFYGSDSLRIFVNTSASSAGGTMLAAMVPNYNPGFSGWAQYTYTIPAAYTGTTNYIIFRAVSDYGFDIFIDDVEVNHFPIANCSGTPLTPAITDTVITTPFCRGGTIMMTAANANLPATTGITYQWQSASSSAGPWSNVSTGTGDTTLMYTTGPISDSAYYRIGATCINSSITAYSAAYLIPVGAPQPGPITGSSTFCPGDTTTYSVPNVAGTTYTWTLPNGWSGTSASDSILVTPDATAGSISVTATTACGTSIARKLSVVPGNAPAAPGIIAGNDNICPGSSQTYSVAPVAGASSYIWTLPSGWTGSSNTNSINTTANTTSGNVTVMAVNGCGSGAATTLPVSIILTLANPGIITGKDSVCAGSLQTYSIAPVPGATSYVWTLPSGWSGTTTDTLIQAFAGSVTGTLSVKAYMSCATSPASAMNINVTATVNPAVTITAPPAVLCQGSAITITAASVFPGTSPTYQWQHNGMAVSASGSMYTSSSFMNGDIISVVMTSNAACAANTMVVSNTLAPFITPSVTPGISINTNSGGAICKGTPLTFTTISTGDVLAYQWFKNGVAILSATASTYTDAALSNADTLTVEMTTSATCATTPVATSNKVGVSVNNIVIPTVSITVSPTNIASPGQSLTFTATQSNGGATPDYQWLKNGVNIPFGTGDTYTSSTLQAGDHITVKMLSYEPCAAPGLVGSNEIVLKSALGVAGAGSWDGSVKLYPNPTSGRFTIAASWAPVHSGKQVRIDVLSVLGQSVYHGELIPSDNSWQTQVDLAPGLSNGHYILRLSTADGTMGTTLPFILNR